MPRRRGAENRETAPDPVFSSTLAEKFICSMMWDGKKSTAQKIFYSSMQKLEERGGGEEAIKLFKKAVENAKPLLEVKTRRVGGANYRCRSKCRRPGGRVSRAGGFFRTRAAGRRRAWPTSWPTN